MAQSLNFAAGSFVVVMAILAALTCEARPNILVQEVVQKSATAEIQHHDVLSPGRISPASQPAAPGAVIHNGTAPKSIKLGTCSFFDIGITNNAILPASTWEVQISNKCQCPVSHLILYCPHFSSGVSINPLKFKINGDGTCLVNNGQALGPAQMIVFKYMEVYKQSLTVKAATFAC